MEQLKKLLGSSGGQQGGADLVGVDFSTSATKVVRLKKNKDKISLMGIDLLPAVDFSSVARKVELPKNLRSHYACLTYSGSNSMIRMINAPLAEEDKTLSNEKLKELLNAKENYRVSAKLIKRGTGRQDSSFIAAAIPVDDVTFLLNQFPVGAPAPSSLEVSGLSYISAFLHARGKAVKNDAVCLIEVGESGTRFAFLNKGILMLVGKFDIGGAKMRSKVAEDLGVDEELAETIMTDRSINIATVVLDVMTPLLKQLSISKDFIERHQSCRISKIYVSGGVSLLAPWTEMVKQYLHIDVVSWNPFENILCESGQLPAELAGQTPRFAAAVGAAIGGLYEL